MMYLCITQCTYWTPLSVIVLVTRRTWQELESLTALAMIFVYAKPSSRCRELPINQLTQHIINSRQLTYSYSDERAEGRHRLHRCVNVWDLCSVKQRLRDCASQIKWSIIRGTMRTFRQMIDVILLDNYLNETEACFRGALVTVVTPPVSDFWLWSVDGYDFADTMDKIIFQLDKCELLS